MKQKQLTSKSFKPSLTLISLAVIIVVQGILLYAGFTKIHDLEVSQEAATQTQLAVSMAALSTASLSQPVLAVADNKVYLPEMRIAVPLTVASQSLLYGSREVGDKGNTATTYDVTVRGLSSLSPVGMQQTLACTPLRVTFEDKVNPFNPHEKPATAVKLSDGRTLQIYRYSNAVCDPQWQASGTDPVMLAQLFEQATSY